MTGPVRADSQWWGNWQRLGDDERHRLLADLEDQIAGRLPPSTEIERHFLPCYPRHSLLRFRVSSEVGPRESLAFYSPGQLYPLDWERSTVQAFDRVALEIRSAGQAEDYLRFATWAQNSRDGRFFIVERADDLSLRPGEALDPDLERRADEVARPLALIPSRPDDPAGTYRFQGSILHGETLRAFEFLVGQAGFKQETVDGPSPVELPVVKDRVRSDRYFVLVRETSLSAERFLRHIASGRPLNQARVTEPVQARGQVFPEPVMLSQVTFDHGADFEGARFENTLTLEQCVFEGQLSLRDATVEGSISAQGLRFHRAGHHKEGAGQASLKKTRHGDELVDMEASGLHVEGSVYLEGLKAPHVVDFSRAKLEGDLRLGGSVIGESRAASEEPIHDRVIRLDAAEIHGDLDFVFQRDFRFDATTEPGDRALDEAIPGYSTPATIVRGTIWGTRLHVHGELFLPGLRCEGNLYLDGCTLGGGLDAGSIAPSYRLIVLGSFLAYGSKIAGNMIISGNHIGGELQVHSSEIDGSVFARTFTATRGRIPPVRVKGQVDFSGTHVNDIDFEGAHVGDFRIVTGEVGRLRLHCGLEDVDDDGAKGARIRPFRTGRLTLQDMTVRKTIMLAGIEVTEDRPAELQTLDCGGDLLFWGEQALAVLSDPPDTDEGWLEGAPPVPAELRTALAGDLKCAGLRITGRAVLANVKTEGRLLLKNCEIGQDLNLGAHGPDPSSSDGRTTTECRHLDVELTRCGGDVDFSGLRVRGDGASSSVHARQLQAKGRILFCRPLGEHWDEIDLISPEKEHRVEAYIEGQLDLSVAEAAHLVISGSSFQQRAAELGINFERGRFRRLQVIEPWPAHHNLSDVQVERWEIPNEHLRSFLDRSEPFRRSTYVEIERVLRNKAQDAEADSVYRAMRARAIREAKKEWQRNRGKGTSAAPESELAGDRAVPDASERSRPHRERWWTRAAGPFSYFLRTTGSRILGFVYGWGTLYWAPLAASVPFALLTWAMLSIPSNVVASPDLVVASGAVSGASRGLSAAGVPAGATPDALGVDWGASDGLWLTIRYHIPVVPLTVREDWRPTQEKAELSLPRLGTYRFLFSAESWAFAMYLANWILWPLFLYGLARRIVREKA